MSEIEERKDSSAVVDQNDTNDNEPAMGNLSLSDITEGANDRGIPISKFIDDLDAFSAGFSPVPASAELLIGAYSELHAKYKSYEASLTQKRQHLEAKLPELKQSFMLVETLKAKAASPTTVGNVRYALADNIYARAALDYSENKVNLWLGANVMLEYTYDEAIEFLTSSIAKAETEFANVKSDLGFVRDQIVTSEVNISRIYNWDVRRKRDDKQKGVLVTATGATS